MSQAPVHSDAYRDIDTSFEVDEAGYIAEDEEMACGCAADARWLAAHNLSLGVEGGNGMASVGGRVPPSMNVLLKNSQPAVASGWICTSQADT